MDKLVLIALSEGVMLLHFWFVLFVIFGGVLVWIWPEIIWLHIPSFFWGVLISFFQWRCPLTGLEKSIQSRLNGSYEGGFIESYLRPVLYPDGAGSDYFFTLGLALIAFNFVVYSSAMIGSSVFQNYLDSINLKNLSE